MSKSIVTKLAPALATIILLGSGCGLGQPASAPKNENAVQIETENQSRDQISSSTKSLLKKDKDGRMILDFGSYQDTPEVCKQEFNEEAPSTSVTYSDKEWGISLKVPYNPKWGNQQYSVLPHVVDVSPTFWQKALYFGNVINEEAVIGSCVIDREYMIRSTAAQTADKVISNLPTDNLFVKQDTVKKKTLAGLQVVSYEVYDDLCSPDRSEITIVGKKFNYVIRGSCGVEMKELEDIVKTVKLID